VDPAPGPELVRRCLADVGIGFLFAPVYHAATKNVAGPRREVGFRTLFNLLGPMTNPASARYHVNGVFARERCEFLACAHGQLGSRRAMVVYGNGGLDEFAPTGPTFVAELDQGNLRTYEVSPSDFGLAEASVEGLKGGEPAQNADMLLATLRGQGGASRIAALMTASAGLVVTGGASNLREGAALARDAIDSGNAMSVLDQLRLITPLAKP
jgi:anthranilate phosphoribosyltransferase